MKAPAFQFYVGDFLVGTARMNAEQVGMYVRLLCEQWDKGFIPDNDAELLEISGGKDRSLPSVKKKFLIGEDGNLRNERLEAEREKQANYRERQSLNGAKGGRPKKPEPKPKKPKPFPSQSEANPSQSSSSSTSFSSSTSEESGAASAATPTPEDKAWEQFQIWMKANAPRVQQMKEPINFSQFLSLKEKYGPNVMMTLFQQMHNYGDLLKKVSANLTFRNWAEREPVNAHGSVAAALAKKQEDDLYKGLNP